VRSRRNAGGALPAPYLDTTPQGLDDAFHFNVSPSFELTKRATPYLLESERGSVINITEGRTLHCPRLLTCSI
jgi:7-alpha-hydroxysteroid dehydrogenase